MTIPYFMLVQQDTSKQSALIFNGQVYKKYQKFCEYMWWISAIQNHKQEVLWKNTFTIIIMWQNTLAQLQVVCWFYSWSNQNCAWTKNLLITVCDACITRCEFDHWNRKCLNVWDTNCTQFGFAGTYMLESLKSLTQTLGSRQMIPKKVTDRCHHMEGSASSGANTSHKTLVSNFVQLMKK